MKSRIFVIPALILSFTFLFTFSVNVFAEGPVYVIDCTQEFETAPPSIHHGDYTIKDGALHWVTDDETEDQTGADPYLGIYIEEPFDADQYPYAKFCIKNLSDLTTFEFHYTYNSNISPYAKTHFEISAKDSEFKTYIINIPEKNLETQKKLVNVAVDIFDELDESTWTGDIEQFRIDFLWAKEPGGGCVPDGAEMYIKYIAFFKTAAEAEAYDFDAAPKSTPTPTLTPSPTPSNNPTSTVTSAPSISNTSSSSGSKSEGSFFEDNMIWIIAGGAVIVVGAITVFVILRKKK